MPLFDFVCSACGHSFEDLVRHAETPPCPECQDARVERRLSVFAVSSGGAAPIDMPPGACGTCGDPRGPGSCSMD